MTPTLGTLDYNTVLLDYRKYFFMKPFTLAMRGMHYGLYGKDSESNQVGALYLGDGSLVRGYSYNSFTNNDCATSGSGSLATSTCPQFDRLVGSRLAAREHGATHSVVRYERLWVDPESAAADRDRAVRGCGRGVDEGERAGVELRIDVGRSHTGGKHGDRVADQPVRVRRVPGVLRPSVRTARAKRGMGLPAAAGVVRRGGVLGRPTR